MVLVGPWLMKSAWWACDLAGERVAEVRLTGGCQSKDAVARKVEIFESNKTPWASFIPRAFRSLPCFCCDIPACRFLWVHVGENRSRKDFSPWEQCMMYRRALEEDLFSSNKKNG